MATSNTQPGFCNTRMYKTLQDICTKNKGAIEILLTPSSFFQSLAGPTIPLVRVACRKYVIIYEDTCIRESSQGDLFTHFVYIGYPGSDPQRDCRPPL
jgi:hypothetical protein